MRFSVGQKIFSIAVVILALMTGVAIYSVRLTAQISADLETIVHRHLPILDEVTRLEGLVVLQGVDLQRLIIFVGEGPAGVDQNSRTKERIRRRHTEIEVAFDSTLAHLVEMETKARLAPDGVAAIRDIEKSLEKIRQKFEEFEEHALHILHPGAQHSAAWFSRHLDVLNARQDGLAREIEVVRSHLDEIAHGSVEVAEQDERHLLIANTVLTLLALAMGLGFATIVTRVLVRSVKTLVVGAERIEGGELDVTVNITSDDEVGRLARAFNAMVEGLKLKERIKDTFGKYMDPRVVSGLLDSPELSEPGGQRREMTVMFVDLKGFTDLSERLPPNDLVKIINRFFQHMTEAISNHSGVVDKFMGDAVMAYWGPPFTAREAHAREACAAGLEALARLDHFRDEVAKDLGPRAGDLSFDLRIGVSTGPMIVGTVGSEAARNFTVMGDPVNLGSRLEGANKTYGTRILISEETRDQAGSEFLCREIDYIRVKGKERPTRVFEVLPDDAPGRPKASLSQFIAGLASYRRQDWDAAETAFRTVVDAGGGDPPAETYLNRIALLRNQPPPPDWDGVWVFETK